MGVSGTRCATCGVPGREHDVFCARCGQRIDDAPVTMIPLDGRDPLTAEAVAGSPPRTRRSRTSLVAAAATLVVALVAWSVLDDDAGAPPSGAAPTTAPGAGGGAGGGSGGVPTTVPVVVSAPSTTVVRFLGDRPVPVLDGAQGASSLWVVADDELVRVEMATGAVTRSTLPGVGRVVGAAPGLVVVHVPRSNLLVVQRADGSAPVRHAIGADTPVGLSGATGVWLVGAADQRSERLPVRLLGLDGSTVAAFELPVGFFPQGFGDGRVWGERFGRIWTAGLDGQVQPYASGRLSSVSVGGVLWIGCDDALRCTYRVGRAGQADLGVISLPVATLEGVGTLGALAPDGRSALEPVPGRTGPQIVDLATGAVREVENAQFGDLAWSTDGDWLVLSQTSLTLLATNVRDGRRVELVFGFLARDISSIAIG